MKTKFFDPMEEIAKRRIAQDKANFAGEMPGKVETWLDPDSYTDQDDELSKMIEESRERKKKIKDLAR